jgi:hypothetical protein
MKLFTVYAYSISNSDAAQFAATEMRDLWQ